MKTAAVLLLVFLTQPAFAAYSPEESKTLFQLWNQPTKPASGPPESIGSYSAGCLAGAAPLKIEGVGYSVMRVSRQRYYGHPTLVNFLEALGKDAKKAGLPLVLVGDMARPRGGPMISGHASHQVGLDVDIWYRMSKKRPGKKEKESWSASNLVSGESVNKGWGDNERKLVALAAASPEVDRIFVHAAIKKDFCAKHADAPWLYKLRPWWGHADHLHVRLKCPEGSASCQPQDSVAALGPQCGDELAWWFSAEAKEEWSKKSASIGRDFPQLPEACSALVEDKVRKVASQRR